MKKTLVIVVALGLGIGFFYFGSIVSEQKSSEMFQAKSSSKLSAPKKRATDPLSKNLFEEMAVKMLPDNQDYLGMKLTMSQDDLALQLEAISDRGNIDLAKEYLLTQVPSWEWDKAHQRFTILKYLTTSLANPQNENIDYAIKTVDEIISTNNFKDMGDQMQVTLALADRAHLYQAMLQYHPAKASEIYERSRGTFTNKLLDYAQNKHFEAQRKLSGG